MRTARTTSINLAISVLLTALVLIVFGRSLRYGFVNYDDSDYVYENPHVTQGVSLSGIEWAFTHVHAANWHPLTTISHMVDCQIYGLHTWGHHLTNILLHAITAVLLFHALCRLAAPNGGPSTLNPQPSTSLWPSAFVAAVFAVHPLRVESVAWISERKDVLSGVFFMLTLLAYARYVNQGAKSTLRYLLVLVCFALGLLCKPTLVTIPFVLLLLDYWPLRRYHGSEVAGQTLSDRTRAWLPLVREKLPLFALSVLSCGATIVAQKKVIEANLRMTFVERATNAAISYVAYLKEMIWPFHLVVSHPYSQHHENFMVATLSLALLALISVLAIVWRKRYPFLLTGWFWYLGVLVPMIGVVQVSAQSRADRYTYLAQIGIYIIVAWGVAQIVRSWRVRSTLVAAPALIVITALGIRSFDQTQYWRNSEALWRHALDTSTYDYIAHDSLGYSLLEQGKIDDAISEYETALRIKPDYAESHNNLGNAMMLEGRVVEATDHYRKALELDPDAAEVRNNLGNALFKAGKVDEAIEFYRQALAKDPRTAEVQYNLGNALIVKGNWPEAAEHLQAALKQDPHYAQAHNKLGITFGATGRIIEALKEFKEAVRLDPKYAQAQFNLGYILVHAGHRDEGVSHLNEAVRLNPDYRDAKEELQRLGAGPNR